VELRGVSKRYRARGPWVLREIDAELVRGQLIRVTGPPPLIQHRGCAVMSTAVAIATAAASGSPANAAIRATSAVPGHQLPWMPVLVAGALAALTWTVSVLAAAPHGAEVPPAGPWARTTDYF
jgi:hypothetical protein